MGTHITIFEFIIISGASIIGYAFVKTILESFKRK